MCRYVDFLTRIYKVLINIKTLYNIILLKIFKNKTFIQQKNSDKTFIYKEIINVLYVKNQKE